MVVLWCFSFFFSFLFLKIAWHYSIYVLRYADQDSMRPSRSSMTLLVPNLPLWLWLQRRPYMRIIGQYSPLCCFHSLLFTNGFLSFILILKNLAFLLIFLFDLFCVLIFSSSQSSDGAWISFALFVMGATSWRLPMLLPIIWEEDKYAACSEFTISEVCWLLAGEALLVLFVLSVTISNGWWHLVVKPEDNFLQCCVGHAW